MVTHNSYYNKLVYIRLLLFLPGLIGLITMLHIRAMPQKWMKNENKSVEKVI